MNICLGKDLIILLTKKCIAARNELSTVVSMDGRPSCILDDRIKAGLRLHYVARIRCQVLYLKRDHIGFEGGSQS